MLGRARHLVPRRSRSLTVALFVAGAAIAGFAVPAGAARSASWEVGAVRVPGLGTVLVTPHHRVLYEDAKDRPHTVACTGACATVWPPYLLPKGHRSVRGQAGIHGLGTLERHGRLQVTVHGHPLYLYAGDTKAGQTLGEGVEHEWYAVHPGGHLARPVAAAATGSSTTSSTTPPASGATSTTTAPDDQAPTAYPSSPPGGGGTGSTPSPSPSSGGSPSPTTTPTTSPPPPTTTPTTSPPPPPTTTPTTQPGGGYGY